MINMLAQTSQFHGWLRSQPDRLREHSPYFILTVVCSAMFLDLANLSAVTIALPTIKSELKADVNALQWVISAYALTFGAFLLVGGRGGDLFGHRNTLMFGMLVFALFSFVCALTPTFIGLVVARAFQGIGAAFTVPSAQAHIALFFTDPAQKATALGIWGASGSLGFILGLVIGGILTDLISWRWIFWISLILSGLVIPFAYLIIPRPERRPSTQASMYTGQRGSSDQPVTSLLERITARITRFDVVGICLVIPALMMLTYSLTSANVEGWGSGLILGTLIGSIVLLALFVAREIYASSPLLKPQLFHDASFNLTLLLAIMTYAVRQACTYFLTLQLQSYGNSPLHTAVLFIPLGVSALVANNSAGRLIPLLGARAMFILGWAFAIPGVLLFSFITRSTSYWRFTFPGMILYIAGIGAVYITANFVVVSSAAKADQGVAAGVFNVALQVGGSVLGLAVLTAVAQGIDKRFGTSNQAENLSEVGYQSVYYSCVILCGIGLVLSVFAIRMPESLAGRITPRKKTSGHEQNPLELDEAQRRRSSG